MLKPIHPDKNEILRYMGHRGQAIDEQMQTLIHQCIAECESIAKPMYVYKVFDTELYGTDGELTIASGRIKLAGSSIKAHLEGSKKIAIMAVTLGAAIDNAIRILGKTDLTKTVILEAAANVMIEAACDQVQDILYDEMKKPMTKRFSPGYGDMTLDLQPQIIAELRADIKIGLTVNEKSILLPRKSVTGFIGIGESIKKNNALCTSCHTCNLKDKCIFRKSESPQ